MSKRRCCSVVLLRDNFVFHVLCCAHIYPGLRQRLHSQALSTHLQACISTTITETLIHALVKMETDEDVQACDAHHPKKSYIKNIHALGSSTNNFMGHI